MGPSPLTTHHCIAVSVFSPAMIALVASDPGDSTPVATVQMVGSSDLCCCRCLRPISSSSANFDIPSVDARLGFVKMVIHADSCPMALAVEHRWDSEVSSDGTTGWHLRWVLTAPFEPVVVDAPNVSRVVRTQEEVAVAARPY